MKFKCDCGKEYELRENICQEIPAPADPGPKIQNIVDQLRRSHTRKPQTVPIHERLGVILHHSGTMGHLAGSHPRAYANFHVTSRGWPCIAYTWVIQRDGTIYECLGLMEKGYHAGSGSHPGDENKQYWGICFSGNLDVEELTDEQFQAGVSLVKKIDRMLKMEKMEILRHSDVTKKSCPGSKFPWEQFIKAVEK